MAKKELAEKKSQLPAQINDEFIPGLEGVEQDMLIIPRLKLVQKMSVETDSGVAPGSVVNSMTKDVVAEFGKDGAKLVIIPIVNTRSRIRFKPYGEGGGILCRSFDGKIGEGDPGGNCLTCPHSQWTTDEKGQRVAPECSDYLNVFVLVRGYNFPVPLTASFTRTSMTAGRQLINYFYMDARKNRQSPWHFAYELSTEFVKNDKGSYYVFKITPAGKATDEEAETGRMFYEMIRTAPAVEIDVDEEEIKAEQERVATDQNEQPETPKDTDDIPF